MAARKNWSATPTQKSDSSSQHPFPSFSDMMSNHQTCHLPPLEILRQAPRQSPDGDREKSITAYKLTFKDRFPMGHRAFSSLAWQLILLAGEPLLSTQGAHHREPSRTLRTEGR